MILPTTYLGPVEWYRRFLSPIAQRPIPDTRYPIIEVMESFPKQTYRNRCTITMPIGDKAKGEKQNAENTLPFREGMGVGSLTLTVPVKRADSKQLTRDVEISYQQRWQHQHWIALMSAYKRTPYFDYYADFFRPFYEKETKFLVDFNEELHEVIIRLIANNIPIAHSPSPIAKNHTTDWSGLDLEPCFGDGQSILDLLFEYGPETIIKLNNANSIKLV